MDSIDFDDVKAEKAKALYQFDRLQSIGFLFRVAEICAALLFFFWFFTCLPFAFQISGEFFRRLACVVSTPLFMFILGNAIVVAILSNDFTVFSVRRTIGGDGEEETDIYDAFIRSGEDLPISSDGDPTEEIVFDDKQMIAVETDLNSKSYDTVAREDREIIKPEEDVNSVIESSKNHPVNVYRRSKSEVSSKQSPEMVPKPSLQRSETGKCRKIIESCEEIPLDDNYREDNMSNEEFQKTIEAFIAKQLIFRRRESLAVVIHKHI